MANHKQKLGLTWTHLRRGYGGQVGNETRPRLEPRILPKTRRSCIHSN